jgi:hypothetical protein
MIDQEVGSKSCSTGFWPTAVVVIHALFIVFTVLGGLLVLRWPRLMLLHLRGGVGGARAGRRRGPLPAHPARVAPAPQGRRAGYGESFIDHYITSLIYVDNPRWLHPCWASSCCRSTWQSTAPSRRWRRHRRVQKSGGVEAVDATATWPSTRPPPRSLSPSRHRRLPPPPSTAHLTPICPACPQELRNFDVASAPAGLAVRAWACGTILAR